MTHGIVPFPMFRFTLKNEQLTVIVVQDDDQFRRVKGSFCPNYCRDYGLTI